MPVSQKELEYFLWRQSRACEARGLRVGQSFFATGRRYRNLKMGRCGVAQQVSVRFEPPLNCYYVQVLAATTGTVTLATYQQARQQLTALRYLLGQTTQAAGLTARVHTHCVLIGRQVQVSGELADTLARGGIDCQVFTYRYEVDGLRFEPITTQGYLLPIELAALDWLGTDLLTERADALAIAQAARANALTDLVTLPPAELADLVVTPVGVLAIPDTFR